MKGSVFCSSDLSEKLCQGAQVLFPTDTLPALGSLPSFASKIWALKRRSLSKPLILMGGNSEDVFEYVHLTALEDARELAKLYWPGALTMVLPTTGKELQSLNPRSQNIGMRVPDCSLARELLIESGPLATTSANISGELPASNAIEASKIFPELPLLGPIPWPTSSGLASTVILWERSSTWRLLRKGAVLPEL